METISVEIEGTSPLLMHNPAGSMAIKSGAVGRKTIPTPEEEAEAGLYRTESGLIALPSAAFRACTMAGAKGRRMGKEYATTVVKGGVFTVGEWTPLALPNGDPLEKWDVDVRRVVVQRNGVMRARARFGEWAGTVTFEHDPEWIAASQVAELLSIGGRIAGVGDYRPERTGPFGRFEVIG